MLVIAGIGVFAFGWLSHWYCRELGEEMRARQDREGIYKYMMDRDRQEKERKQWTPE